MGASRRFSFSQREVVAEGIKLSQVDPTLAEPT